MDPMVIPRGDTSKAEQKLHIYQIKVFRTKEIQQVLLFFIFIHKI